MVDSLNAPTVARLKAKPLALDSYRENVAVLSRRCHVIRPERLSGSRRLELTTRAAHLFAKPIIADDDTLVGPGEIGLPLPLWRRLCVTQGDWVDVSPARPPSSLRHLGSKLAGAPFSAEALVEIVRDLAAHRWTDIDVTAFLIACAGFMTADETLNLTRA